jgi:DNA polymerase-3 subunit delta
MCIDTLGLGCGAEYSPVAVAVARRRAAADNRGPGPEWNDMRIRADQLARDLGTPLGPAWLVTGDEPLLVGEAADVIRARARDEGYLDRETFFVEPKFDWGPVLASSQSLSLFSSRRLLEIRMPAPRPGVEGGRVLAELATQPPPDTIVLVVTGRLERDASSSAWVKAFERHGALVQAWPVEIGELPRWVSMRAARHGLELGPEAARLLAQRVEGNLLAAHQEIEKLALLHQPGMVDEDEVAAAVANSARYDVFQLGEAALGGDAARALRILEGLRGEGAEPPIVLWLLCREIRALAQARRNRGAAPGYGRQAERRARVLEAAVRRMAGTRLGPLVSQAARVDRCIKGLGPGDPWDELASLVARLAGLQLPAMAG